MEHLEAPRGLNNIITLPADDDDDVLILDEVHWFNARPYQRTRAVEHFEKSNDKSTIENHDSDLFEGADPEVIDLTAIPDVDVPPSEPIEEENEAAGRKEEADDRDAVALLLTEAACLQVVLNVFPDISINYVLGIIKEKTTDATRTVMHCEQIITGLLDATTYPKQADEEKNRKRKRGDDYSASEYEKDERDPEISGYERDA